MSTMEWPKPADGGPPQQAGPAGSSTRSNFAKVTILLILLAGLCWVALITVRYCQTNLPVQNLPGISSVLGEAQYNYQDSYYGAAGLDRPYGVATNAAGDRIYVTETDGDRLIRMFNREGREIGAIVPPDSNSLVRVPLYVAVAPDDRVYVTDRHADVIYVFNADGQPAESFTGGSVGAEGWNPVGLTFDSAGNMYVTDVTPGKHRAFVFDSNGLLKLQFGSEGTEEGQFSYPNGIAVDSRGRIYVADGNNGRLQVFDAGGKYLHQISSGYGEGSLSLPRGVAIDDEDNLFVVDTSQHTIKVYDVSGNGEPEFLYAFGQRGMGDGQLRYPNGVAVDSSKRLYVTDRENGRIQMWSYQR